MEMEVYLHPPKLMLWVWIFWILTAHICVAWLLGSQCRDICHYP